MTNEDSTMVKSSFTGEKNPYALKQAKLGTAVSEICRTMGIQRLPSIVWRKKYSGIRPFELKHLRLLEDEKGKLKQLVVDTSLDNAM